MIKIFCNWMEINELAVRQVGKWAVYIGNNLDLGEPKDEEIWNFVVAEVKRLYPDWSNNILSDLIQGGLFFFEIEAELDVFYSIFDAPLTDSSGIYACTYNPSGYCLTENT